MPHLRDVLLRLRSLSKTSLLVCLAFDLTDAQCDQMRLISVFGEPGKFSENQIKYGDFDEKNSRNTEILVSKKKV